MATNNGGNTKDDQGCYAPRERHFAGMFSELEASLSDERRDWYNNRHALLLDNLLACIREQQAALSQISRNHAHGPGDIARAVLTKWRIE